MSQIEIKYSSATLGGGYFVEVVQGQSVSTQGAMNMIRARVPDAKIDGIVIHPSPPPTPPPDSHRRW